MATQPKIDTNDSAQAETGRAMVLQYLQEAHATEQALVTNLRAHISMTPRGSYRDLLERHLAETQQHERAVARAPAPRARGPPPDPRGRQRPRHPRRRLRPRRHDRRAGARPHQGAARP